MQIDDERDEEIEWERLELTHYAGDLLSQHKWFATALELIAAMSVLEPHVQAWWQSMHQWSRKQIPIFREHGFHATYMMLAAFAIENLAKGQIVSTLSAEERAQVRGRGMLPERLQTHKLVRLIADVGIPLAKDEQELLLRLERAAVWFGRYPIPRVYRARNAANLPEGRLVSTSWQGGRDVHRIDVFLRRLRTEVGCPTSLRRSSLDHA